MRLLNIANQNFYVLMIIVILILSFIELRECAKDTSIKVDRTVCSILILLYGFLTLGIFILSVFV